MFKWLSFLPCHHFDRLLPFYPPGAYTGVGRGLYLLQQQQDSSVKVYFKKKTNNNEELYYLIFIEYFFNLFILVG
jgi:hypothetical protein